MDILNSLSDMFVITLSAGLGFLLLMPFVFLFLIIANKIFPDIKE